MDKSIEKFTFDSVPEYTYRVEDIYLKKTIAVEYGHNYCLFVMK